MPIAAGLVRDRETGWVTIGTAVRPVFVDAAFKAVAEAYSLQTSCRSLDDEQTYARIVGRTCRAPGTSSSGERTAPTSRATAKTSTTGST
ncbi:hypothetical protein [Amycolatopsis sp. NPDC051061]|uniref:hypothetical protein n=1 Tax=Amycolatopsis sp. NPDC051061 TaxID=3155042 RepID=UPI003436710B